MFRTELHACSSRRIDALSSWATRCCVPRRRREIPLDPQVVEAIRRRLPPGGDPAAILFTGPAATPATGVNPG